MGDKPKHISVLLNECIENLNIKPDGIYVDGTLGLGGHSEQILKRLTSGRLIGIDRDESAIRRTGERLKEYEGKFTLVHGNFCDVAQILDDGNALCVFECDDLQATINYVLSYGPHAEVLEPEFVKEKVVDAIDDGDGASCDIEVYFLVGAEVLGAL